MKKFILSILTIICVLGFYPSQSTAQTVSTRIPILMYHRIQTCPTNTTACADITVQPSEFVAQMQYLRDNGYKSLTMEQVLYHKEMNIPVPAKTVVITFDDGYYTQYSQAFPTLRAYGMKATYYITSDIVGLSGYLSWANLQEMQRSGAVEVEGHTATHLKLGTATLEQVTNELQSSKQKIESYLNTEVTHLAYPNGSYTQQVIDIAKSLGYKTAVITCRTNCKANPQPNSQSADIYDTFRLDRRTVYPKMTLTDFASMLN